MKGYGFYSLKYTKGKRNLSFGYVKGPKGLTDEFYGFIKSRKRSIFVIESYLNERAFTAVKRDAKFQTRYVKRVIVINRRYTKRGPFSRKRVYKKGNRLDLGAKSPREFVDFPPCPHPRGENSRSPPWDCTEREYG